MKVHKKPSGSYGYISFTKEGKVNKSLWKLPDIKANQEMHIAQLFVKSIKQRGRCLGDPSALNENDHDFLTEENSHQIEFQIVELPIHLIVESAYSQTRNKWLTPDDNKEFYRLVRANSPMIINKNIIYDQLLLDTIKNKLNKKYSRLKSRGLWLLIWCLYPYETEYYAKKKLMTSNALMTARDYLKNNNTPFDEFWFFNMITAPVLIYSKKASSHYLK